MFSFVRGGFSGGEDKVDELDGDLQILEVKFSKLENVLTLMQQSDDVDMPPKWSDGHVQSTAGNSRT